MPMLTADSSGTSEKPNILFLIADDLSDLGCYGNNVIQTPNLDQLAAEGMRFTRAYASSPQCSPSRTSIFTGRYPHEVHASRLHSIMPKGELNFIELLNQSGYYTGAYRKVHQPTVRTDFQFYGGNKVPLNTFFEQDAFQQPFFLHFGSHDPHRGYHPENIKNTHNPADVIIPDFLPDTPKVRKDVANYYDEIARFDRECSQLLSILDERGLRQNTLVVMSSDQGMPFPRSKPTLYEAGLKVPLIVRWPGIVLSEKVSKALVSLIDLTATWLDAAGILTPEVMQSRSLMPILREEKERIRDYIFAERNWHDNWDPMRCIISDRYKLIQRYRPEFPYTPSLDVRSSPSYKEILRLESQGKLTGELSWYSKYVHTARPEIELYDLVNDPGEWNNLTDGHSHQKRDENKRAYQLQLQLSQWMQQTHDFLPPPRTAFPGGPEHGYNSYIDPLNSKPYDQY